MASPRVLALLLALLTLLVYLPATTAQFINYDDPDYVLRNDMVQKGVTWEGVRWAFAGAHASNWHPLTWISHMVDCDLFRLNPAGPHLVNGLFHALNTALLFILLFRLTGRKWPSVMVAALFGWHPLHVESVAWVAERKDVLSTFFTLLTLFSYTDFVREKRRRSYWLAWFYFGLALLSKPMPVTLPCVMLLLDFWPLQRVAGAPWMNRANLGLLLEKVPFFLLSAGVCLITVLVQHRAESTLTGVPFGFRLENMVVAYVGYLSKLAWPVNLAVFYPLKAPLPWRGVAEAAVILAGISVLAWSARRSRPWQLFGWLWFLVTLVPVIGLVQVGAQSMADRYAYFPSVGIFVAVVFSLAKAVDHFAAFKNWAAAALVLGGCLALTERQLTYWHDSESLFTHALAVADSSVARLSLGVAFDDAGRKAEALQEYIMAAQLDPISPVAYGDIGRLLAGEDKALLAAEYYQIAIKYAPKAPSYHDNLGVILAKLRYFPAALREFNVAAAVDPSAAMPHFLIGRLLLEQGQDEKALSELRQAIRLDPANAENLYFVASVLASDEQLADTNGPEACALAEKAVELTQGQQPAALDVLAMGYAQTGRFEAAKQTQQAAIEVAQTIGLTNDLPTLQKRLQNYAAHRPWRQSFREAGIPGTPAD